MRSQRRRRLTPHTMTPRQPRVCDGDGVPLMNRLVQPVGFVKRMIAMFNRRAKNSRITRPNRIDGKVIIKTTGCGIKRQMDGRHIVARQYKKVGKGICGSHSWIDFNRMKVDKDGHFIIPISARFRRLREQARQKLEALKSKTPKPNPDDFRELEVAPRLP